MRVKVGEGVDVKVGVDSEVEVTEGLSVDVFVTFVVGVFVGLFFANSSEALAGLDRKQRDNKMIIPSRNRFLIWKNFPNIFFLPNQQKENLTPPLYKKKIKGSLNIH